VRKILEFLDFTTAYVSFESNPPRQRDDQEQLTQEIEENLDAVIEAMNRMWQPRGIDTMRLPSEAQTRSAFGRGTG